MTQTVGGVPIDPTTKKAVRGNDWVREKVRDLWRLSMMLSAGQLEVQSGAKTKGSCFQVPGLASQE